MLNMKFLYNVRYLLNKPNFYESKGRYKKIIK